MKKQQKRQRNVNCIKRKCKNSQVKLSKYTEKYSGITLIALVITIVVLIILAGISINLVLGENGLFTRAKQAVEDFNQKAIEEKLQILYAEQLIDQNTSNTSTATKDATSLLEEMVGEREITQKDIEQFNKYLEKYEKKITSISSKEDLKKIGTDEAYPLDGMYVQLEDIMNEEEQATPIGTEEEPFTGVYNGNGKKIENLTINVTSEDSGMFGVNTGTIKNVTIENCTISSEYARVGAIAGSNSGLIENCIISGGNINSSAKNDEDGSQLGGICGINNDWGMIRNCKNYASVTGERKLVGGICGYNRGGNIENCTNYGIIEGLSQVGGITGDSQGIDESNIANIKNCINEGSVSAPNSEKQSQVGGIVGWNQYSTVSNCVNKGNVTGNKYPVGGIVGNSYLNSLIIHCYNLHDITGNTGVGGIAGTIDPGTHIDLCYNLNCISGQSNIGGIVGAIRKEALLTNSYNKGKVVAESNSVGGLVGSTRSPIENCCNTGEVILKSTTNQNIGALFGYVYTNDVSVNKFKNCYYLEGTAEKACGNEDNIEGAIRKKENEMPSLADILGNEFASSIEDN